MSLKSAKNCSENKIIHIIHILRCISHSQDVDIFSLTPDKKRRITRRAADCPHHVFHIIHIVHILQKSLIFQGFAPNYLFAFWERYAIISLA